MLQNLQLYGLLWLALAEADLSFLVQLAELGYDGHYVSKSFWLRTHVLSLIEINSPIPPFYNSCSTFTLNMCFHCILKSSNFSSNIFMIDKPKQHDNPDPTHHIPVCPSVRLSVCPSLYLSVCPSVHLSACIYYTN